ncbi:MAG: hypothetical protein QNJ22_14485 [Desulfosarcinaceae bacterium]|nr:hypothetical protein [Desulfosarcinaceae bacterium]
MVPDGPGRRGRIAALPALAWLLLLSACAGMPALHPLPPGVSQPRPFLQGRWQLTHRIEAIFPGNHTALLMGALELDSETRHLRCALMTVEGFTLFSAAKSDRLRVTRAVPPFDGPGFAEGLMADLALLFLAPRETRQVTGSIHGRPTRRFLHMDGTATDVSTIATGHFRIDRYSSDARLIRRALLTPTAARPEEGRPAAEIHLDALGDARYALRLTLIDAVRTDASDGATDSP